MLGGRYGTMVLNCEVDNRYLQLRDDTYHRDTTTLHHYLTWKEAYYGRQLFRLNRSAGFGIIFMRRVLYERSKDLICPGFGVCEPKSDKNIIRVQVV